MINRYAEIAGLSEADFNKLKTEFGLTDDLMQIILNDKMSSFITFNLKLRCVWYCLIKEFEELDAKFIFYACIWNDITLLNERCDKEKLLEGYERYKCFFKNN